MEINELRRNALLFVSTSNSRNTEIFHHKTFPKLDADEKIKKLLEMTTNYRKQKITQNTATHSHWRKTQRNSQTQR